MTVVAMLLLALACWVMRTVFVALVPAERLPQTVRDGLQHLPPAVLAALITVELLDATQGLPLSALGVILGTVVLAAVAARRTGSLALAVAIGSTGALVVDVLML